MTLEAQLIRKNREGSTEYLLHFIIAVNDRQIPLVTVSPLHSLRVEHIMCGFGFELADCSPEEVQAVLRCYLDHARLLDVYFRTCQQFEMPASSGELSDLLEWKYLTEREIEQVTHRYYMSIDEQYRDSVTEHGRQRERAKKEEEKLKRANRPTYLYLMRNNRTGDVKIGHGKRPSYRESTFQAEDPDVELIDAWRAVAPEEKQLHMEFAGKRKRGEWFTLTDDEVDEIKARFTERERWKSD